LTAAEIKTACGVVSSLELEKVRLKVAGDPSQGVEVLFYEKSTP